MSTIISLIARKGGAGKTTSAANLAAGLASHSRHTLAVDADAQGHLGVAFGLDVAANAAESFARYVTGQQFDGLTVAMHPFPSTGSLLPGGEATRQAETELSTRSDIVIAANRFRYDAAAGGWDCAVIDSGPRGPLQDWAVAAADIVIVAAPCNYLGASAVFDALRLVQLVGGMTGRQPQAWVLPTMYESFKRDSRFWLNQLQQEVSGTLLAPIPMRVKVSESLAAGVPLVRLAPTHDAAVAYMAVVDLLEQQMDGAE